jgi:hypothetical protein
VSSSLYLLLTLHRILLPTLRPTLFPALLPTLLPTLPPTFQSIHCLLPTLLPASYVSSSDPPHFLLPTLLLLYYLPSSISFPGAPTSSLPPPYFYLTLLPTFIHTLTFRPPSSFPPFVPYLSLFCSIFFTVSVHHYLQQICPSEHRMPTISFSLYIFFALSIPFIIYSFANNQPLSLTTSSHTTSFYYHFIHPISFSSFFLHSTSFSIFPTLLF